MADNRITFNNADNVTASAHGARYNEIIITQKQKKLVVSHSSLPAIVEARDYPLVEFEVHNKDGEFYALGITYDEAFEIFKHIIALYDERTEMGGFKDE
jgi:hypothetical protein